MLRVVTGEDAARLHLAFPREDVALHAVVFVRRVDVAKRQRAIRDERGAVRAVAFDYLNHVSHSAPRHVRLECSANAAAVGSYSLDVLNLPGLALERVHSDELHALAHAFESLSHEDD